MPNPTVSMNDDLKTRIERELSRQHLETGEKKSFSQWMREAADEKLTRENAETSGLDPEDAGATA